MSESNCRKGGPCSFTPSRDLPDATIEVCMRCGTKVVYNKINGRIDNVQYLRNHRADMAQPFGRTHRLFEQTYGKEGLIRAKKVRDMYARMKTPEQKAIMWEEAHREARKDLAQRNDYGKKMISNG